MAILFDVLMRQNLYRFQFLNQSIGMQADVNVITNASGFHHNVSRAFMGNIPLDISNHAIDKVSLSGPFQVVGGRR